MVAATGVLVAAIYYIYNIRINQRAVKATLETRQTQLFMQVMDKMDQRWLDDLFEILNEWEWKDFDDFDKRYGPLVNAKFRNVFGTLEHIGILVNDGLLSPRLVWLWLWDWPLLLWKKYESVILEWRERYERPPKGNLLEFSETLVLALEKARLDDAGDFRRRSEARRLARESLKGKPTFP